MAKRVTINSMNIPAFATSGIESIKVVTSLLREGTEFKVLRGLRTLKIRKALKFTYPNDIRSTILNRLESIRLPGYHDQEVNQIPAVTQVGISVDGEPHGNNFESGFNQIHQGEHVLDYVQFSIERGQPVSIGVIIQAQDNCIQNDGKEYEAIEPPMYNEIRVKLTSTQQATPLFGAVWIWRS